MKVYIYAAALLLTVYSSTAAGNYFGNVFFDKSKTAAEGATVRLIDTAEVQKYHTITDSQGKFSFHDVRSGKYTLHITYVGYKTIDSEKILTEKSERNLGGYFLEETAKETGEIVVSANRNPTERRLAPSLVKILNSKLFEETQSVSLVDGLKFQPGVRTECSCQNCGMTEVRINGLDGHYSQILVDSRPVFSGLTSVYGLEQIPIEMIDRVEVIRGGGSALSGSSAIGGSINIITKNPTTNSGDISHSIMAIGGGNTFENNTSMSASLVSGDYCSGIYLYGQKRNRGGYDADGDGYTDITKLQEQALGVRSFLRINSNSQFTLQLGGIHDFRRGGNLLDLAPDEANIAEQTEHDINSGEIGYNYFSPDMKNSAEAYFSCQNTERKSYYGGIGEGAPEDLEAARKAYGKTHDLMIVTGGKYSHSFEKLIFMPSEITAGVEYNFDKMNDKTLGYGTHLNQNAGTAGAFLQNEWKNEKLSVLLGGRLDKHNMIQDPIASPRVNVRFSPKHDVDFRATYSEGFRAPQAYDEDLHVSMVGGERVVIRLADALKAERSQSFSLSSDYFHVCGNVQTNIQVEGFFTALSKVFAMRRLSSKDADGNDVMERYNSGSAEVIGANIEGKAALDENIQMQAGVTVQRSSYGKPVVWDEDAPAEKKMLRSPNVYGYFTANFNPLQRFSASITGNYTGCMLVGHSAGSGVKNPVVVKTPDFFELNLKFSYDIPLGVNNITMRLSTGIQNLTDAYQDDFDKGWDRDSGYIYGPEKPRSVFAGIKLIY